MNTASPLSKDHKAPKKDDTLAKFKKEKLKISVATTKKILKASKKPIGNTEAIWLNGYIENRIQGECLPRNLLSNDLPSEIANIFGTDAERFINQLLEAFKSQCP